MTNQFPKLMQNRVKPRGGKIGPILVMIYVWEVILGKSQLAEFPYVWVIHMVLSALLTGIIVVASRFRPPLQPSPKAHRMRRPVIFIYFFIASWGVISAIGREKGSPSLDELGFIATWIVMVIACWQSAPRLVSEVSTQDLIRQMSLPLKLGIIASYIMFPTGGQYDPFTDRLRGAFYTSPSMGEVAMLCCILVFAQIVVKSSKSRIRDSLFLGLELGCLFLTRSRAGILAALVAMAMIWFLRPRPGVRLPIIRFFTAGLFTLIIYFIIIGLEPEIQKKTATFLRVEGGTEHLTDTRWGNWELGYRAMLQHPVFGLGFTSRYAGEGIQLKTRTYRPEGESAYTYTDDPHSMTLTLGKSIGIPGFILGVALLLAFARIGWKVISYPFAQEPIVTTLIIGLIIRIILVSFTGNPLLSFGAVGDRYLWICIGILSARMLNSVYRNPSILNKK